RGLLGGWRSAARRGQPDAGNWVDEPAARSSPPLVGPDATGVARFRLHALLRDYAAEALAHEPAEEQTAALRRAHDGWLQLASLASAHLPPEPFFPRDGNVAVPTVVPDPARQTLTSDPIGWVNPERLNILAITKQACELGRYEYAARLALSLASFHHLQNRYPDALQMWRAIAEAARVAGDARATARALVRLAAATMEPGYATDAMELLDE